MRKHRKDSKKDRAHAVNEAMARLALGSEDFRLASSRLNMCLARQIGAAGSIGIANPAGYCRLVICEACQISRCMQEHTQLLSRIHQSLSDKEPALLCSVTLSSPLVSLPEAEATVDRMLRSWQRLADRKAFQSAFHGYARTVRLEIDASMNAACCHTNILAIRARHSAFRDSSDWHTAWQRNRGSDHDLVSYYSVIDMSAPGGQEKLDAQALRITCIGVDPGELCEFVDLRPACNPEKLGHVLRALKGRKLIHVGRSFVDQT